MALGRFWPDPSAKLDLSQRLAPLVGEHPRTYGEWPTQRNGPWNGFHVDEVVEAARAARVIVFDLTGLDPQDKGRYTMNELVAILSEPSLVMKTMFVKDGAKVPLTWVYDHYKFQRA